MKRILLGFLALTMLVSIGAAAAQIEQQAVITPTSKVYAAWQPFENGVMMWWSDLDQIWVLINPSGNNPGQAYIYEDTWNGESYTSSPPLGRYGAVRGFGKVWSLLGGSSGQLGWALAPELGYDSASRSISGNQWIIGGPGDTEYGVTFQPSAQANIFVGVGNYYVIDIG